MTELIILSKKDKNKKKLVWDEFAKEVDYPDIKFFFWERLLKIYLPVSEYSLYLQVFQYKKKCVRLWTWNVAAK